MSLRIVVVDRDVFVCDRLAKYFVGHEVYSSQTANSAVNLILDIKPDLIVYEAEIPGWQDMLQNTLFCNTCRKLEHRPTILTMGTWESEDIPNNSRLIKREKALSFEHGADMYDRKPLRHLVDAVKLAYQKKEEAAK